jgi:ABC-type uncharacterized transport system permease subunit
VAKETIVHHVLCHGRTKTLCEYGNEVQRVTIIATVFIPLSFVCAVWGMNLKVFGSGDQPIWVCFISAVPIVLFALLIYYWDGLIRSYQEAKSTMEKMSEGLHDIKS